MEIKLFDMTRGQEGESLGARMKFHNGVYMHRAVSAIESMMGYMDVFTEHPEYDIFEVAYALEVDDCQDVREFVKDIRKGA